MLKHTVLVTGGTGPLGREVVERLRATGHTARVGSRGAARPGTDSGDWATIDYRSGAGCSLR